MAMETVTVWLVYTNDDLTEGRGLQYVQYVCEKEATALRLAKGGYVQGTDCPIRQGTAFFHEGNWYYPGTRVMPPSRDDMEAEKRLLAQRSAASRKKAALEKAALLGMTDDEIAALSWPGK